MSTPAAKIAPPAPSEYLAAEVRAELGRRNLSLTKFAASIGRDPMWAVRRLGASRFVDLPLEEAAQVAAGLGIELVDLIDSPRVLTAP